MLDVFKKIWKFSGKEQKNIKKSIFIGFINAIFNAFMLFALYIVLNALVNNSMSKKVALTALIIMVTSVVFKIITQYFSQLQRTHAGYFMVANKRIEIGQKLKSVPMGYFNKNSLGNITAIGTTILGDVENAAPVVLVIVLGGFLNTLVFTIGLYFFDWRIGLIASLAILVFLFITSLMERRTRLDIPRRQEAQANLVDKVLETIQGMSVVKAFNLDKNYDSKVNEAIDESYKKNKKLESRVTPFAALQEFTLRFFSVVIIISSIFFYINGTMPLVNALIMVIASFLVFEQLQLAGVCVANVRITENSITRSQEIDKVPLMDEGGKDIALSNTNIEFKNVSFSYDKRKVLNNISLTIPEKKLTAIVGPSGSGKTTLCRLISRFWDVNSGEVLIGGVNVKDFTLESLMKNVSEVFQNVYLFSDTIENNIKFGKPDATHEEVVEASKRACCDDFINELPDGYNTVISEGGGSLSGGQKQRISIARALIKDAPIVIFDEATANVDPENEDRLQKAIEELTKDKTVIMIAHRLKTVRNADQILVIKNGELVQQGKHEQLIKEDGVYQTFINRRKSTIGWKLGSAKK